MEGGQFVRFSRIRDKSKPASYSCQYERFCILESSMASDFINYQVLFRLPHIKHSKDNDLFDWFEDAYIIIDRISRINSIGDVFKELKNELNKVKGFDEPDTNVYPNLAMRLHPEEAARKD